MWYNVNPLAIPNPFVATSGSPPAGADGHREFLIFRIPLSSVAVPEPSTMMLLIGSSAGMAFVIRRRW